MSTSLNITSLTPEILATLLSNSYRQRITEEQVRIVAESGNLLSADDNINLLQYTAFLTGEASNNNVD